MVLELNLSGLSGIKYPFRAYLKGQEFNPVPGVYAFCKQEFSGDFGILYVGETHSFQQRLNSGVGGHKGYRRAEEMGMTHVAAMVVSDETERLRIETDLRHLYTPPANAQSVPEALGINALRR